MPECDQCGREVVLPFKCAYCGGNYCVEHRLPENHNCAHRPKTPPPYLTAYDEQPLGKPVAKKPTMKSKQFSVKKLVVLSIIAVIAGAIIWSAYPTIIQLAQGPSVSPSPSTTTPTPTMTLSPMPTPPEPTPSDALNHEELVDYALSLINSDRHSMGLQNVTLSSINSGQRHAEDMLANTFFSHWDTNGYKPYMRYTLAGGKGSVAENCAWQGLTGNIFGIDVKSALEDMEWSMMYDDASSNWGHRDNILDPLHNRVSIGVAYNNHNVYLVQDFENDYVSWNVLNANNNQVTLEGTIQGQQSGIEQIGIFYDNPTPLTSSQLEQAQYQDGYDAGTYVGLVLPPNWQATGGITITADSWTQSGNNFQISFSLSQAVAAFGKGVYTLYLETGSSTADALLTYSVWIN
jgi:uncharacterized protein YkwD